MAALAYGLVVRNGRARRGAHRPTPMGRAHLVGRGQAGFSAAHGGRSRVARCERLGRIHLRTGGCPDTCRGDSTRQAHRRRVTATVVAAGRERRHVPSLMSSGVSGASAGEAWTRARGSCPARPHGFRGARGRGVGRARRSRSGHGPDARHVSRLRRGGPGQVRDRAGAALVPPPCCAAWLSPSLQDSAARRIIAVDCTGRREQVAQPMRLEGPRDWLLSSDALTDRRLRPRSRRCDRHRRLATVPLGGRATRLSRRVEVRRRDRTSVRRLFIDACLDRYISVEAY